MPSVFKFKHFFLFLTIVSFVFFTLFIFTNTVHAATGINRQINFQGKLVNNPAATNVTDTSYTVVFTLYNNPNAGQGTALWTETQNVTTADGIFRVALGSVTPFPANFNFNWTGLYLGVKVGSDSEMTPRIQMAAVPFAFNAEKVSGLTVQDTSGNASTSGTLQVGNGKTISFSDNISFGTGTTGTISLGTGTNTLSLATTGNTSLTLPQSGTLCTTISCLASDPYWNQLNGTLFPNNSTVDLLVGGQSTTSATFGILNNSLSRGNQVATLSGSLTLDSSTASIQTTNNQLLTLGGNTTGDIQFKPGNSSSSLYLSSTGNVGIGTADPTFPVDVVNGLNDDVVVSVTNTDNAGTGSRAIFRAGSSQTTTSEIVEIGYIGEGQTGSNMLRNSRSAIFSAGASLTGGMSITTGYSTAPILFGTAPDGNGIPFERMRLTANGKFGFGTSNPLASFDIRNTAVELSNGGTIAIASFSGRTSFASLVVNNDGVGDLFTASSSGTNKFTVQRNGLLLAPTYNAAGCTLKADANGLITCGTDNTGSSGADPYWNQQNGSIFANNSTADLLFGGQSTASANLRVVGKSSPFAGTAPAASVSAKTSYAAFVIDNLGVGDLFTASSSGLPIFTIKKAGTLVLSAPYYLNGGTGCTLKTDGTGLVTCGTDNTGGGGGVNWWNQANGALYSFNSTVDLLIGGQSTTSAKFAFLNVNSGNPTASISGNLGLVVPTGNNPSSLFNILNGGSLNFQTSPGGDANLTTRLYIANNGNIGIGTTNPQAKLDIAGSSSTISNSSGDITITPTANLIISQGKVGINAASPLATFDIRPNTVNGGTIAIASFSGRTSFASLVVNNDGVGDLFTASSSGTNKFTVQRNGLLLAPTYNAAGCTLKADANGLITCGTDNTGVGGGGYSPFQELTGVNGGVIVPNNSTMDFLVGGQSSATARFAVLGMDSDSDSTPTASISAGLTGGLYMAADGKIQTTNMQTITIGGDTTGNVVLNPSNGDGLVIIGSGSNKITFDLVNGPAYSGTARPPKKIILSPEYPGASLTASNSATILGNLTSDASPSASWRTYYDWTSVYPSFQDYTVAVRITLPLDFSAWSTSINAIVINFNTELTTTDTNKLDVILYSGDSSTPVAMRTNNVSSSEKTWTTVVIPASELEDDTSWNAADQTAVFYLKMYSKDDNYVQIGDIELNYLSAY